MKMVAKSKASGYRMKLGRTGGGTVPDRGVMQWRLWRLKPALKISVNNFLFKVIIMKI